MRMLLSRTLIMLAILGLVFTPLVLTGNTELQQAELKMDMGDFSDAAMHYARSARLLPWRQDLWEQAGMAQFFAGKFTEALPLFERANTNHVLSAEGWDWLGQSYWRTGDHQSAQASWNAGLENYPSYTKYYVHLSMIYFAQGDLAAEKQALERWLASETEASAAAHYRLGQLLILSDPDRALKELILASSLEPEYDPAMETLRSTINLAALESDESRRLVVTGRGLGLVNEWPLAEQAFRQAVAADVEYAEAWAWLGEAEQQLGLDGRAELDEALKLGCQNPIVRSLRGLYWVRQEKYSQALTEYSLAAEHDPENPAWQFSIGEMYAMLGDLPLALERYQRATEIAPTDASTWRLLADFCSKYNVQVEEIGLPAARMAVELAEDDPITLDTLGWTLTLLERYEEAQDTLEQALELYPDFALGYFHLGIVALQTDDWQSALENLQIARDLNPGGPVGEQAQVLLNQYFP